MSISVHTCVCLCVCVDPAFNSCRDPGTPAYGIPVMAQGFQVRPLTPTPSSPILTDTHTSIFMGVLGDTVLSLLEDGFL